MRILIVTSNFLQNKDNNFAFFEELLKKNIKKQISGVIFLDNYPLKYIKSILGLIAVGAFKTASQLSKNLVNLFYKDKRRIILKEHNIPILNFNSMNEPRTIDWVKENNIDLIVNAGTRCIFRKEILRTPNIGCINIHPGLLPKYRGLFCNAYALYHKRDVGFTIHNMEDELDGGRILRKKIVYSPDSSNIIDYHDYEILLRNYEAAILSELLEEISLLGRLPDGEANFCQNPIYEKFPSLCMIRKMKKSGVII